MEKIYCSVTLGSINWLIFKDIYECFSENIKKDLCFWKHYKISFPNTLECCYKIFLSDLEDNHEDFPWFLDNL